MISRSKSLDQFTASPLRLTTKEKGKEATVLPRSRTVQGHLNTHFTHNQRSYTHTPVTTPWEAREDPFSLAGFFPQGEKTWEWLNQEERPNQEEDASSFADEELRTIAESEGEYEEFAKQVIDGEDKYGMLAFSSKNIPRLLKLEMHTLLSENVANPIMASPLSEEEPGDLDSEGLYARYALRRRDSEEAVFTKTKQKKNEFGTLFLGQDDQADIAIMPNWMKVLSGWVGSA
ncbi:hypothetical protein M422DRAFT_780839 [Sphaerobolus stellatus SS14]|uniref:Uncharacterized protein n=1 Tax=Sphaerobolus stellatus (strain SS14) TaxID=990650 RepID=A0A0C9VPT2_SPHS4|nr:hypothetical protein M422DRAFT_780839 [Sphaerobolus stellatus SS14]